ncbi:HupE/UreJ family protein [Microvirga soli]|uniref:HupE/UreJ family protein n=1 Tax=Microvirga soli TaxID=1854496 RepID=UPI0019200773|nr:HupE/UreJ family protein [Microvirga soli]
MTILPKTRLLALTLTGLAAATPALAHHPMGGMIPATFTQGLLSGLGHPVIGLDHLAALVGVGLVASRFARGLTLPAFWVVAMAAGVGLHLASFDLPYTEALVALSVVAIGLAATIRTTLPYALIAGLFAIGGAVHGYALGESIIGAETSPLSAYLIGLVAVQTVLTTGIALAARFVMKGSFAAPAPQLRLAGLAVAVTGAAFLALPAFA